MVAVAQSAVALGCGPSGCGFKPHLSPKVEPGKPSNSRRVIPESGDYEPTGQGSISLAGSLTVGHETLTLVMLVRVQPRQPEVSFSR